MTLLPLSRVCKLAGITRAQLRFWRKHGLVSEPVKYENRGRGAGSEAFFPPTVLGEVERVRCGLASGRSLAELKAAFGCKLPIKPPLRVGREFIVAFSLMAEGNVDVNQELVELLLATGMISDLCRVEVDPENPQALLIRWRYPQADAEFRRRIEMFFGKGKPRLEALGRLFADQRHCQLAGELSSLEKSLRRQVAPERRKYLEAEVARVQRELQALSRLLTPAGPTGAEAHG